MGERLFGRNARLVFTPPLASTGIEVTGLRIKFKVEKSLESAPNKAAVAIYNMNETNRSLAESQPIQKKSSDGSITLIPGYLLIDAGYGEREMKDPNGNAVIQKTFENVFAGDLSRVLTRFEGSDIITEFEAEDGAKEFKDSKADLSFAPGTNMTDVFAAMTQKMGLKQGEISGITAKSVQNGLTVSGPIRRFLDTATKSMELEWSIQDGALQIIKKNAGLQKEAVHLSPETGLIGSPKKKDVGIEVTSLLQPKIAPGRLISIESKFIKGNIFRVLKVTHEGDTHDKVWYTTAELEVYK